MLNGVTLLFSVGWAHSLDYAEGATGDVLLKNCSEEFPYIYRKNACVGVSFNKIAGVKACNFIKKRYRCFPVNIVQFLRKPILNNICVRLFLIMTIWLYFSGKFVYWVEG